MPEERSLYLKRALFYDVYQTKEVLMEQFQNSNAKLEFFSVNYHSNLQRLPLQKTCFKNNAKETPDN